jgi:hypothetical protein
VITDDLEWLGTWYRNQCDGRWEHHKGMLLEPVASSTQEAQASWRLRIDLRGTTAAGFPTRHMALYFMSASGHASEHGLERGYWVRCSLTAQAFEGEGAQVEELVGVFRRWIGPEQTELEAVSAG